MSAVTNAARVACRVWIPIVALALTITATTYPRPTRTSSAAILERVVVARLTDIPSHNRLYRASLDLTSDSTWTLLLRSASGVPIPEARLAMKAWMPEHESVAHATAKAPNSALAGMYRVRPVALDRPGWWNISVQISGAAGTDSLAFNVILK